MNIANQCWFIPLLPNIAMHLSRHLQVCVSH